MSDQSSGEIFEGTPFNQPLVDSSFDEKIKVLKNDPEKVIRIEQKLLPINEAHSLLLRTRSELEKLSKNYQISVPDFEFILAPNKQNPKQASIVYVITENIHGQNLRDITYPEEEKHKMSLNLERFYSSLTRYYFEKLQKKEEFIDDIVTNDQFVYGRRNNDEKDDIFLVDIQGHLAKFNIDSEELDEYPEMVWDFEGMMGYFITSILESEEKVGLKFYSVRTTIKEKINNCNLDSGAKERLLGILQLPYQDAFKLVSA